MKPTFFARLAALEAAQTAFVLATVIDHGGSTPRVAGARMAIWAEGFEGTIGGGAFELHIIEEARRMLGGWKQVRRIDVHLVRDLGMCCGGRMSVFMEQVEPRPPLRIYGAGHIGTELAAIADRAGFAVTVVDGRAEWADATRFPEGVAVEDADPEDHLRAHPPGEAEFVVVVTHDHPLDEALVRMMLPAVETTPRYLGLIGSRGKWARFVKRYTARGFSAAQIGRVRCPVGLDLGGTTPAEIALSIVAELVTVRRGGPKWGAAINAQIEGRAG